MKGAPRSKQFNDVYFSAEDGMAETSHVFLQGNGLPAAMQGRDHFTIAETGFGTGLNFLCVLKMLAEMEAAPDKLDFISFERFPLNADEIRAALHPFQDSLSPYLSDFLEFYKFPKSGQNRFVLNDRVMLTLYIGDINEQITSCEEEVDCWFLDGFTPAKNPDMWTRTVFENMARLSAPGASLSSFTAAGAVRRGLMQAGFEIEKKPGFGRKRDMIVGRASPKSAKAAIFNVRQKIAIIGGGLAGTACAYILKQRGYDCVLYEKKEAVGREASGNPVGLYNPRFSAHYDAQAVFYSEAFKRALTLFPHLPDIDFDPCGALHLMNSAEKDKRFAAMADSWAGSDVEMKILGPEQASETAGIEIPVSALWLPGSGAINPQKLCEIYAKDTETVFNRSVSEAKDLGADIIILACAQACRDFVPWLPIHTVRGQISAVEASPQSAALKCNVHYGGYMTRARGGAHVIGSSFQKWLNHTDLLDADHNDNLEKMRAALPILNSDNFKLKGGRAGLRTSSQDRFPIAGAVPGQKGMFVTTAHASHGIVSSLGAAILIADMIGEERSPLSGEEIISALSPQRFIDRANRKHSPLPGYGGH